MKLTQLEINKLAELIAVKINNQLNARWLKLKSAAIYSSIGKSRLKQLAIDGEITGFSDPDSKRGDWIFDKISLDQYRESQSDNIHKQALAILRTI